MKRLRIFAGPNGSGKSTIIQVVKDAGIHLGIYVNADEYKKEINTNHAFDLSIMGIQWDSDKFLIAYRDSKTLYSQSDGDKLSSLISFNKKGFSFPDNYVVNDYFTSFLAGYVRCCLLESVDKFTFETVMSHPSKLEFMQIARSKGYKIYLYFVSLSDPILNMERVKQRVLQGGHDVPTEKIKERYYRTMNLLFEAIKLSDKAYIFDNSHAVPKKVAIMENKKLIIDEDTDIIPTWLSSYVLSKFE